MLTMWTAPTLNTVFDDVFRSAFDGVDRHAPHGLAADVHETDTEYTFEIDVPGVKVDDLEITLARGELTVSGARKVEGGASASRRARRGGRFSGSFSLPEFIESEGLSARLEDGVLTVRVPKQAKAQPRRIAIRTGTEPAQLAR